MDTSYDLAFRMLAGLNVLVLLVVYAIVSAARKRQERMERKVDLVLLHSGLGEALRQLDEEYGRESGLAPLE